MLQKIKTACFVFSFCFFLQISASDQTTRSVETLGDIFQFLPAFAGAYALYIQDYQGLKELGFGFGTTISLVYLSKTLLQTISKKSPDSVYFAKRPNGANFQGFPSGHTASAFSAVGFLQKRYGWKFSLPAAVLATFTGYSRIKAKKHTTLQVITGAMLGFTASYLFSSRWIDASKEQISLEIHENEGKYMLRYSRFF